MTASDARDEVARFRQESPDGVTVWFRFFEGYIKMSLTFGGTNVVVDCRPRGGYTDHEAHQAIEMLRQNGFRVDKTDPDGLLISWKGLNDARQYRQPNPELG